MTILFDDFKMLTVELFKDINPDLIQADSPFNEFGLDSLDVYEVIAKIEEIHGFSIPNDAYHKIKNFQDLIDYYNTDYPTTSP